MFRITLPKPVGATASPMMRIRGLLVGGAIFLLNSAGITGGCVNPAPAAGALLVDRIAVSVKAVLHNEDFRDAIAIKVKLVDEVDGRVEPFRREVVRLVIDEGGLE